MTVAELIESLKTLPQDMEVMMLDSDRESPVEIIQVSRGTWGLDLADEQVLLFRNSSHGGYGVLHRRPDGSIGWIDAGPLPRD